MDETTRMIIAYAALLMGLPILAAKIVWFVPGAVAGFYLYPKVWLFVSMKLGLSL